MRYGYQKQKLALVVLTGDGPSLLGRNWLKYTCLDWNNICTVHMAKKETFDTLLKLHECLSANKLGNVKPFTASLQILPSATMRFLKPCQVSFTIKNAVSRELYHVEKQGIILSVSTSQWAAPIVIVSKKDGRFRICNDYKVMVNQALDVEEYPLPTPNELFSTYSSGRRQLQAYLQVPVDGASKPCLTVNTY